MARNVYYPDDFDAHKNISHKLFPISVFYFMDYAVSSGQELLPLSLRGRWNKSLDGKVGQHENDAEPRKNLHNDYFWKCFAMIEDSRSLYH